MRESDSIDEHRGFQARFWLAQRVVWVVLGLLLVAALFGATGGGWLSQRTVSDDALSIGYPAILRRDSSDTIEVTLFQPGPEAVLHFDTAFLETFRITGMSPAPASSFATPSGVAHRFETLGEGPARLRIDVTADRPAHRDYAITAAGRLTVLTSLVLP